MSNIETTKVDAQALENVLAKGDLSSLSAQQRVQYYNAICSSLGVNPLTRPFDYITLKGKLTLYAKKDCTDQLRSLKGVSITSCNSKTEHGMVIVEATASDKYGRCDSDIGIISIEGLKGEALANAYMKANTKAKRRVTLSICGLGLLDESEVDYVQTSTEVTPPVVVAKKEITPPVSTEYEYNEDTIGEIFSPDPFETAPPEATPPAPVEVMASKKQSVAIYAIMSETYKTKPELISWLEGEFKVSHTSELTKKQASEIIEAYGKKR